VQNAVDAIYKNLDEIPTTASLQQLQSAIVIIDNRTGDIVAMSGGVGEDKGHDDYNRATDAKLQPGSSAKPLTVYGPAFELGVINPATIVKDLPYEFKYNDETDPEKPTGWPRNSNKKYNYSNSIFEGVTSSTNAIAINTLATMGVDYSFHFAKEKFGLEYLTDHYVSSNGTVFSDVNLSPLGLGGPTIGVTVRQMATAYATFPNKGVIRDARTYTKVYNSE
jgi:penicillin-binding protein 1A